MSLVKRYQWSHSNPFKIMIDSRHSSPDRILDNYPHPRQSHTRWLMPGCIRQSRSSHRLGRGPGSRRREMLLPPTGMTNAANDRCHSKTFCEMKNDAREVILYLCCAKKISLISSCLSGKDEHELLGTIVRRKTMESAVVISKEFTQKTEG